MGKIVLFLGPTLAGQEILKVRLMKEESYNFHKIIKTTTREKRFDEIDGDNYHFISVERLKNIPTEEIVERKDFDKITYFTHSKDIDLENNNYLDVNSIEGLDKYIAYYGENAIVPIFVKMNRDERIQLVLTHERQKKNPNYSAMCQKYLDEASIYSDENLAKRNITDIVINNCDLEDMVEQTKLILSKRLYK